MRAQAGRDGLPGLPQAPGTNTQRVALSIAETRELLRVDYEFFIQFFLGEELTFDVPGFHVEIFREMVELETDRVCVVVPRAHAKTTLSKLACVWHFLFSPYRFILYMSGTHNLVVPYVNDIIAFMESDNFRAVFGELTWYIRQDGNGKYKFRINSLDKVCILRGLGAGERVRGINVDNERPELVMADDIEDTEINADAPLTFQKLRGWWFGPFIKCINPIKNKIVVAGNLTSKNSLLWMFLNSDRWVSFRYGCIRANREPLWPDVWPIDKLRADYREYQRNGMAAVWMAEMMNQPVAEGGGLIKAEEICYMPPRLPGECNYGFITIDPAISRETWADHAAIGAHGWVGEEQQWQTVEIFYRKGMDIVAMFDKAIELAARWHFRCIGVEGGAMQAALEPIFSHLALTRGLSQYKFFKLPTKNVQKTQRLAAWAAMCRQTAAIRAQWALTEGDWIATQQLLNYEPKRRDNDDDIIDMCAMGPTMINLHISEIVQQMALHGPGSVRNLIDFADC